MKLVIKILKSKFMNLSNTLNKKIKDKETIILKIIFDESYNINAFLYLKLLIKEMKENTSILSMNKIILIVFNKDDLIKFKDNIKEKISILKEHILKAEYKSIWKTVLLKYDSNLDNILINLNFIEKNIKKIPVFTIQEFSEIFFKKKN